MTCGPDVADLPARRLVRERDTARVDGLVVDREAQKADRDVREWPSQGRVSNRYTGRPQSPELARRPSFRAATSSWRSTTLLPSTPCRLPARPTLLGRVTTFDRAVPLIEDRLLLAGLHTHCASVRASGIPVLELEGSPELAVSAITEEAKRAIEEDRAEVIVLGCGGMAGLKEAVRAATSAPVVDGVAAAVKLAESLVSLGLSTSKVRTYAPPRPKRVEGWPLHQRLR